MGNFNQRGDRGNDRGNDRGGFRGGNGGGRDFSRPDFQKRGFGGSGPMHQATCAECGKSCEVPFIPKDGRPVYCTDCFTKKGGRDAGNDRGPRRDFQERPFQKPAYEQPRMDGDTKRRLESIEYKIDKVIHAVDLLLGAKLPKTEGETVKKVEKDAVKIKEELTAVVKKVAKEAKKEEKEIKPAKKEKAKAKK
jgi:CxxC-x17-CxxC domain-containing protein